MHIKFWQQHCDVQKPQNLTPGGIRTRDLLFLRRTRWPQCTDKKINQNIRLRWPRFPRGRDTNARRRRCGSSGSSTSSGHGSIITILTGEPLAFPLKRDWCRVARFFLVQACQNGENIPNYHKLYIPTDHKLYQMAKNYTKQPTLPNLCT
jgi:hypothetical protein